MKDGCSSYTYLVSQEKAFAFISFFQKRLKIAEFGRKNVFKKIFLQLHLLHKRKKEHLKRPFCNQIECTEWMFNG